MEPRGKEMMCPMAMEPPDTETVGPYRLLGVLGQGGMATVYRAEHIETKERVALKTVRRQSETHLASIRRDIHALSRLCHPNIVRVLDHGMSDGRPWYAMELLEGETLADHVDRLWTPSATPGSEPRSAPATASRPVAGGQLDWVLTFVRHLCEPLAFLHTHPECIVHQDLKPQNIFLVDGYTPKLMDFGISLRLADPTGRAVAEVPDVAGTPLYMAPEQIQRRVVDARTDLYALGCILYELLTGSPPFRPTPELDVLAQHLHIEPQTAITAGGRPAEGARCARARAPREKAPRSHWTCPGLGLSPRASRG